MIDAHVHLWRIGQNGCTWPTPDLAPIYRDVELAELRQVTTAAGMQGVILVQSQEDVTDTRWLLQLAADPLVMGVIGWVDLAAPDADAQIRTLASDPMLRGLRPMLQDQRPDWCDPRHGLALRAMAELGLVFDALIRPQHLATLERVASHRPNLRIVIDHAAKPDMTNRAGWEDAMASIARNPNIACKLSGLLTELRPGRGNEAIEPIFAHLWRCFGPGRLIWGSDWPVLTLATDYAGWLDRARAMVPPKHHDAVFGGNARRVYGLARAEPLRARA
ncbi:amidohydrolase family protein [Sphingomonas sp. JC676]|uniref:amidohydrolase family protein n=1 Tax=Sphingomonas sp. JC676 TaxID=2768065 RepID=UPI0016586443|nr:amidohydrolase family protein [Sphingomonas sp. JC676]MBC9032186.1 amidohydrolase family protein [Sphingomonas sp. JC676]